ncbi:MAG: HAD-IA family hydrolase, partial [Actinomycetota bacterium]|nr:HAD-IA family hydrolase [Actinomycetota bacterium]
MPASRAVVFDLDDTLYPEHDYVSSGFTAAAAWIEARLGYDRDVTYRRLVRLSEESPAGTFDRWTAEVGADPSVAGELVGVYRSHRPALKLPPDNARLLERLRATHKLGLVTDGYLEVQQRKVEALGLERFLDAVVFSDTHGREHWKPSPRPFEIALEQLDVPAHAAVYVADNPVKDFLGARRAGLRSIRLRPEKG